MPVVIKILIKVFVLIYFLSVIAIIIYNIHEKRDFEDMMYAAFNPINVDFGYWYDAWCMFLIFIPLTAIIGFLGYFVCKLIVMFIKW